MRLNGDLSQMIEPDREQRQLHGEISARLMRPLKLNK